MLLPPNTHTFSPRAAFALSVPKWQLEAIRQGKSAAADSPDLADALSALDEVVREREELEARHRADDAKRKELEDQLRAAEAERRALQEELGAAEAERDRLAAVRWSLHSPPSWGLLFPLPLCPAREVLSLKLNFPTDRLPSPL